VLANDSRLEGGPVQLAGVTQPAHGTVSTNADGTVHYTPAAAYVGNDSFTYSITSTAGGSASAEVFVEVVEPTTPTGNQLVEYWNNIGNGSAVSDLTGHPDFPANPSVRYSRNAPFELPSNYGNNYGSRVRAQIVPSVSGDYTFWIASDDSSELWFSPVDGGAAGTLIAYVDGWTSPREWTKFASQQSAAIPLVAGQRYNLESLHKEGGSLDNLAVGWRGPAPFDTINVVDASHLRHPFAGFDPPAFNGNPLVKPGATPNVAYATSLAGDVTDTSTNETLSFTKVSGPAWLHLAPDGTLSGTPGLADAGTNTLTARVTDSTGFSDETAVGLVVWDPTPPVLEIGVTGNSADLKLHGTVGQHYRVEWTGALPSAGPWLVLTDIVSLAVSPLTALDPLVTTQHFYRAVALP